MAIRWISRMVASLGHETDTVNMDSQGELRSSWVFWARGWSNDPRERPGEKGIQPHKVVVTWDELRIEGSRPLVIPISSLRHCRLEWENYHDYVRGVALEYGESECCYLFIVDPTGPYDVARTAGEPQRLVAAITSLTRRRSPAAIEPNPYVRSAHAKHTSLPSGEAYWDPDISPWSYAERYWPRPWHIPIDGVPGYVIPLTMVALVILVVVLLISWPS